MDFISFTFKGSIINKINYIVDIYIDNFPEKLIFCQLIV